MSLCLPILHSTIEIKSRAGGKWSKMVIKKILWDSCGFFSLLVAILLYKSEIWACTC